MRIDSIETTNFLGLRDFQLQFGDRTLIAGPNGAGKSSVRDAIRFAMLGQPGRGITKKKDFPCLLSEGSKKGVITVTAGDVKYKRAVGTGNAGTSIPEAPPALPYVLDGDRFARLDDKQRQDFLMGLMQVSVKGKDVGERLIKRGVDENVVANVVPLLRGGFDDAREQVLGWVRDKKRDWERITGEKWGAKKGEEWEPEVPAANGSQEEVNALNTQLNERDAIIRQHNEELRDLQSVLRALDSMDDDEGDAPDVDVEALRKELDDVIVATQVAGQQLTCPCCDAALVMQDGQLVEGEAQDVQALSEKRDRLRKKLSDAERHHHQQKQREQLLAKLGGRSQGDVAKLEAIIKDECVQFEQLRERYVAMKESVDDRNETLRAKEQAESIHAALTKQLELADLLGPDGIPAEIMAEALDPVNAAMQEGAAETGWASVSIGKDMAIRIGGERPYGLCSESEQWRADALIAYAIAKLSGLGLMVIDRVDVLDMRGRGQFVGWISGMDGMQVIAAGTFKAPPSVPAIDTHWIENGRVSAVEVAA